MSEAASPSQADKAAKFRALHERAGAFVIANPWDAGSARMLAELGFEALATSSGASAGARGRKDGQLTRDEVLAHAREIVAATDLPVAADLENGFAESPEQVAETIRLAAAAGLVGGSIEDFTGDKARPFYEPARAVQRIAAAVEAARALPFPFSLTARCEHFLRGRADLGATIAQLQAYEAAGADVLFAPALPDLEVGSRRLRGAEEAAQFHGRDSRQVVQRGRARGRRRQAISLATSLYRAAMKAAREAAAEVRSTGSFGYIDRL